MTDSSSSVRPTANESRRMRHLALAACLLVLVLAAIRLLPAGLGANPSLPVAANPAPPAQAPDPSQVTTPRAPEPAQASLAASIEVVVHRNDTLDRIFRRLSLDPADLARIRDLPGIRQSLDFLKPGDAIHFTHLEGALNSLTRKVSETQTLEVTRAPSGFSARMIDNPVEQRVRMATATIDSSLFQSADAAGISEQLALQLANIFAWDIDFVYDLREGDSFKVIYNQVFQDGHYLRDGEILCAEFINAGRVYRAVRFDPGDGRTGFYDPKGMPMRKAFLRSPVEFTRISSRFNPHRHHPILDLIRGHMGTDYAAPTGTPVRAAGDGRISFRGRKGGYGNALIVTHTRSISTLYGHLSRFARGLGEGSRVRQGQVIGYVGMTGLATGPHLHYEYRVNGVHKDPERVRLPAAEPLDASAQVRFAAVVRPLLTQLDAAVPVTQATPSLATTVPARPDPAATASSSPAGN
ncbi:MAG: peptidoglycan DD-metalloendopeptidase family protein [Proteobacteria bacterium]|nr:peptidoglycan DD-metalloendopeptidase family protein [Pseudomonadota bacterium]